MFVISKDANLTFHVMEFLLNPQKYRSVLYVKKELEIGTFDSKLLVKKFATV
jgi:hypothetical protein